MILTPKGHSPEEVTVMMAGDQEVADEILETVQHESSFRYADLTFEEGTDKERYNNLQSLIKTLKRAYTNHVNKGLSEAKEKHDQPHTTALMLAYEAIREYYISTSKQKIDEIIKSYQDVNTLVTNYSFPEPAISSFTQYINEQQNKLMKTHTDLIEKLHNVYITPTDSSTPGIVNKYTNRPDLAEKCNELTEDTNYTDTLDFFQNFNYWYSSTYSNPNDLKRKLAELWQRLTRTLQTELSSKFSISTGTYSELLKAITDRLEMKNPAKNRILHFLSSTKQKPDQSLVEYIHSAHRVAQESGLHDGK